MGKRDTYNTKQRRGNEQPAATKGNRVGVVGVQYEDAGNKNMVEKGEKDVLKRPEQDGEDMYEFEVESVCEVLTLVMSDELIIDVNQSFPMPSSEENEGE